MDVSVLCRSCMHEVTTAEHNFDQETVKMFTFCTNIKVKVSEDLLPRQFCKKCTNLIQLCFNFITTSREVDIELKNIIGSVKSGVKPEIPGDHDFDAHDSGIKANDYESSNDIDNVEFIPIKDEPNSRGIDGDEKSWKENETKVEESNELTDILTSPISPIEHKTYICAMCNKSFVRKKNYEKHISRHNEEPQVEDRDIKLGAEESIAAKAEDAPSRKYQCSQCPKKWSTPEQLDRHTRRKHRRRVFECPQCQQRFAERQLLSAHMRKHGRSKQRFTCHYCNKVFKEKSRLMLHLHMHDDTLKPYLCDICGSRYSHRQAMLNHQLVHTGVKPFTCEECGYTCRQSSNIRRHKRAHQNERKHQCVECGKGFNELSSLKKHMYAHTGERPYKCPHCDNTYKSSGKRKNHLVRAHGLDPTNIPRLAKDGGPARRYVTEETRKVFTLVADRVKRAHTGNQNDMVP